MNYFTDNPDLLWHLEHSVPWDEIVRLTENDLTLPDGPESVEEAVELYRMILEEAGRFTAHEIAPRVAAIDRQGARLVDGEVKTPPELDHIFAGLKAMDLYGLTVPRELGGMNAPVLVSFVLGEVIARADCGVMAHYQFHGGIAMALLAYAAHEGSLQVEDGRIVGTRFEQAVRAMTAGDAWGAMVLTEPGAGSDLGALTTRAVQGPDGRWRLTGEKIFITSGHGQHHIVLARTAPGTPDKGFLDGLSLFLVPRIIERGGERIENIKVTKVEEKLGHASSVTCSLLYEESEAELIGAPGQGFELMLILMNNARVAVGFEAIGVCEAAYRMALGYATERSSMGKRLRDHELIADSLQEMDTDIRGLRALAFEAMAAVECYHKLELALQVRPPADAEERRRMERRMRRLKRRARELTPLLKYLSAEKAVEISRRNMQIHGGMGYIKETGADRLLRDALVLPIYEGTSQIQALMALKDHLGFAIERPAAFLRDSARARVQARVGRGLEGRLAQAEAWVYRSIELIVARVLGRKLRAEWSGSVLWRGSLGERLHYLRSEFLRRWDARVDFGAGLLHAERLTRMLADVEIARILLRQGRAHPERLVYAERYIARMLPRVTALGMEIADGPEPEEAAARNGQHAEETVA